MAPSLPEQLSARLRAHPDLLPPGATVLVAVSGGPDSMALLHLLASLSASFDWTLVAAHFDHGTRPDGRVRAEAIRTRIPAGVKWRYGHAPPVKGRTQAAWRKARYGWLADTARREDAVRIATGHHLDDQVETILFRLLRGTGNRGLAGIPLRRGRIVRPLLGFSRADLLTWLERHEISFDTDPANHDRRHARSRIRHDLLPALEAAMGSDIREAILRLGRRAADAELGLSRLARRALAGEWKGGLAGAPEFVRAEALRRAARREGVRLRGSAVRRVAARMPGLQSGRGLDMGGGLRLEREFDAWRVSRSNTKGPGDPDIEVTILAPTEGRSRLRLGGRDRELRWGGAGPASGGGSCVALFVRPDHYPLIVRARRPGDRIRLPGGSRGVSRLLAADRIAKSARDTVPLVTDRSGHVLCVMSVPPRVAVGSRTNANLVIEVEDD